ncbi:adenosylmethionine--8-amino-7-oxononanoate transaminase [Desulfovibrio sp. OttesenSCG-928-I05]|nr:adenosylmethionine--8-amino-7-oxononanoate transaminase [Desulfovibrio sp. OttesenSCG-928-I05]
MPRFCCITGTDTDAGKTVVTAALARAGADAGLSVLVIKPVQTGAVSTGDMGRDAPDLLVYRDAAPHAVAKTLVLFDAACSPHLAARREGAVLDAAALARGVRELTAANPADLVLVEGAGGLLTPLNEEETLCDVFSLLGWPLLLVAANRLGGVNHALLSLELIRARGIPSPGFILTDCIPQPGGAAGDHDVARAIRRDNRDIITALGRSSCLAELPFLEGLGAADSASRNTAWSEAARALAPVLVGLPESDSPGAGRAPAETREEERTRDAALIVFDREHIWHPYTSALHPLACREAVSTQGVRIRLRDGRELIDGMASWWCAIHGYRHPALMAALREQAASMPHVMFGGLTHEPAVALARRLLGMAPAGLEHVFFADSGSVAVEVALKMALQYQQAAGKPGKNKLLTVRGGYHGDTMGAMSVCDPETGMHSLFSGVLPRQLFAPRPACRFDAPYDESSSAALEALLDAEGACVAALILEPVVQGAGGMWFYHPRYLRRVRELCTEHDCLLILDEIATGFGRTGKLFACEHAGISPDILCLGKGLTGGVMTLAATLASGDVARGISAGGGVLMHGPTFMANPLACAVAGASLDLLANGNWKQDVARIEQRLREGLAPCAGEEGVADVRVLGAIGVVEMDRPVDTERVQQYFAERHGVWIRPFGQLMYVMPPYVIRDEEIMTLCAAIAGALREGAWK